MHSEDFEGAPEIFGTRVTPVLRTCIHARFGGYKLF